MPAPIEATPWLSVMHSRLGIQERPGEGADNPVILGWFKAIGHPEIEHDETSWCAVAVGSALVECGLPTPLRNVNMMARSYLSYGVACEPRPGAIAIWPRGTGWQGHVNIVEKVTPSGVVCIGGNQGGMTGGDAVTRTKPMDPAKALGFRMPIRATVPDLREAGSTEIKSGDQVQNVGIFAAFFGPIFAAIKELLAPVTAVPQFTDPNDALSFWQQIIGGSNALARLVLENPWLAGGVFGGLVLAWIGHVIKRRRVAKAAAGVPLSSQIPDNAIPSDAGLEPMGV